MAKRLGIRWTIGNVNRRGFDALRLSIWGAWRIWGSRAHYAVCVNCIPVKLAREWVGDVPAELEWHQVSRNALPVFIRERLAPNMAEGVGWKFAPVRLFLQMHELMLDNDCILWRLPPSIERWLDKDDLLLIAEDVRVCLGAFEHVCRPQACNSGIRGLPPGLDYEAALGEILNMHPCTMGSELDEQGLQVATLQRLGEALPVTLDEVSICSPFWPHRPHFGQCGAHFVGLNSRHLPWRYYERPADEWLAEHWERSRVELRRKICVPSAQTSK